METNNTTTSNGVHNAHSKDNAAKIVFGDPVLCAQFLKGYTDIPLFKEIKPEDIENVSSHFLPLFQESRDSDTVNKIRIGNSEIYLIALIEHQSENDFDMSFRILRYIVFIWTDYAAQQEKLHKGITINVNIKMYIFDHLRMYIFAILPLDRYIFLSDKIFL